MGTYPRRLTICGVNEGVPFHVWVVPTEVCSDDCGSTVWVLLVGKNQQLSTGIDKSILVTNSGKKTRSMSATLAKLDRTGLDWTLHLFMNLIMGNWIYTTQAFLNSSLIFQFCVWPLRTCGSFIQAISWNMLILKPSQSHLCLHNRKPPTIPCPPPTPRTYFCFGCTDDVSRRWRWGVSLSEHLCDHVQRCFNRQAETWQLTIVLFHNKRIESNLQDYLTHSPKSYEKNPTQDDV